MCGGEGVGGGASDSKSYVDKLTKTIEANVARDNASRYSNYMGGSDIGG